MANKKNNNNLFIDWIKDNLLQIILIVVGMLFAWAALNARVQAIEAKVAKYPSQDWFSLKFDEIEESIDENCEAIKELEIEIRNNR